MSDFATDDPALLEGFVAWRDKQHQRALDIFGDVLASSPHEADAWRGIGSVYWSTGAFDRAMSAFQNALRAAPSSPMHWSNCALAARDLKLCQQALNLFDVALALDPEHHPAWNERSNVLYDMGRFTEALPGYDRALALCQTQAVYFHNRGECRLKLDDRAGAIATFRQALEVDPAYGFSRQRLHDLGALPQ